MEKDGAQLVFSIEEVGKQLNVSRATAYALAREPGFPIIRIGRRKLVNAKALQDWLDSRTGRADESEG